MGASNLKLVLISSTWDCNTFDNFVSMFKKRKIFKSWQVCDWLAKWLIMSGYMDLRRPRVCRVPNVGLVDYVSIIVKFSGVITSDRSDVHAKSQGQRSKAKVTEVTTQLNRFRTVTPVWIHIWWWNDTNNLMLLRRGALLFFKIIRQISRLHG